MQVAYIDIETSFDEDLTVVGVQCGASLVQFVAPAIRRSDVLDAVRGAGTVCTFNGERFDLPVLRRALGLPLVRTHRSLDLSVECARRGLRGGLKAIEASLGISRSVHGVSGYDAMVLWRRWTSAGDEAALRTLLDYNADDVANLVALERRLSGDLAPPAAPRRVVVR